MRTLIEADENAASTSEDLGPDDVRGSKSGYETTWKDASPKLP